MSKEPQSTYLDAVQTTMCDKCPLRRLSILRIFSKPCLLDRFERTVPKRGHLIQEYERAKRFFTHDYEITDLSPVEGQSHDEMIEFQVYCNKSGGGGVDFIGGDLTVYSKTRPDTHIYMAEDENETNE